MAQLTTARRMLLRSRAHQQEMYRRHTNACQSYVRAAYSDRLGGAVDLRAGYAFLCDLCVKKCEPSSQPLLIGVLERDGVA